MYAWAHTGGGGIIRSHVRLGPHWWGRHHKEPCTPGPTLVGAASAALLAGGITCTAHCVCLSVRLHSAQAGGTCLGLTLAALRPHVGQLLLGRLQWE